MRSESWIYIPYGEDEYARILNMRVPFTTWIASLTLDYAIRGQAVGSYCGQLMGSPGASIPFRYFTVLVPLVNMHQTVKLLGQPGEQQLDE